ncbi:MAG: BamA/TamA family outer membrane protein [bacterium]
MSFRSLSAAFALLAVLLFPEGGRAQGLSGPEGLPVSGVVLHGLESADREVVLRRMDLREGARYSRDTARRDERAITALGFFWSVRVEPERSPPDSVTVHVRLKERFPWFAVPEVGWSPEEGWTYGFSGGHLNLMGRGHRLFVTALTGGGRHLGASLSNPWNGEAHESFRIGGATVRIQNRLYDFVERGMRFNGQVGRWFGKSGRGRVGFQYRSVRPDREGITHTGGEEDTFHGVWVYMGGDAGDPWAFPRLGWSGGVRLEGSGGPLGGDIQGGAVSAELVRRAGLEPTRRLVAAARLRAGTQWGEVPFWRLLPLGGPNGVRGYPLGAWLVDERWEASAELHWYLVPMQVQDLGPLGDQIVGLSLALFADSGTGSGVRRVPEGLWVSDRTPRLGSWGAGIRFHNALFGTARLETAWNDRGGREFFLVLGEVY